MSRYNRALDLLKRGDIINKVDEVQPPPKYPFGDLLIKNDDEIRASTAAYRNKLETDNDITNACSIWTVIASAEQIPSTWTEMGFPLSKGSDSSFRFFLENSASFFSAMTLLI